MSRIAVIDPANGSLRWSAQARRKFSMAVASGRQVFALDHVRPSTAKVLSTFGRMVADAASAEIVAYDLATGAKQWTVPTPGCDGFSYDAARDRLIVRARQIDAADTAPAEGHHTASATAAEAVAEPPVAVSPGKPAGLLRFLAAKDGTAISQRQELAYRQLSLVGDRLLMSDGTMLSALDGAVYQRPHPLTGRPATMTTSKGGCNSLLMSVSFSGDRKYWNDLDAGLSGGWNGQDFACKPSFIPAGGLINIWNAGAQRFANRTDTHPRTLEPTRRETNWASSASVFKALEPGWINRLGVQPAAPGYRSDKAGGWWVPTDAAGRLQLPGLNSKGQPTPGKQVRAYETADHRVAPTHGQADIPAWVSGFGIEDPGTLIVPTAYPTIPTEPAPRFRVRLIVSEPDEVAPGQRVFRVVCNGQTVVESLDVAAVAGGRQRSIVREWQADGSTGALRITYERTADSRLPPISGAILVERIAP
jgi:hypothetical protein